MEFYTVLTELNGIILWGSVYVRPYICPYVRRHVRHEMYDYDLRHWPVVKLNVMHISTANISKMVNDIENITIAIKYDVACWLSINISRVDLGLF